VLRSQIPDVHCIQSIALLYFITARGYIVTAQMDQIQALIAEIDSVLQARSLRLQWRGAAKETAQQQQVLERVRNYLVWLQQQPLGSATATNVAAQQMMQTILHEMSYLRANVMQPLQADLDAIRQRRERLLQEVHQLESQRQDHLLNQPGNQHMTSELLQVLMSRLQENLSQQITQTLNSVASKPSPHPPTSPGAEAAAGLASSLTMATPASPQPYSPPAYSPQPYSPQQYEQLQSLRQRSDQMLMNVDASLNVVFESLQRNIQSYHDSLASGIERLHQLGQQSEVAVNALIEQLTQQLKQQISQEASAYLQPAPASKASVPPQAANSAAPASQALMTLPAGATANKPPSQPPPTPSSSHPSRPAVFPYAGGEILSAEVADEAIAPVPALASPVRSASLDDAIESWLQSTSTKNLGAKLPPDPSALDLPSLDLSNLELGSMGTDEDTAQIDAALKMLEELGAKLTVDPTADVSLQDTEAQLSQLLGDTAPATPNLGGNTGEPFGDAQDELDEFYQSLFGETNAEAEAGAAPDTDTNADESISQLSPIGSAIDSEPVDANLTTEVIPVGAATIDEMGVDVRPVGRELSVEAELAPSHHPQNQDLGTLEDLFNELPETAAHSVPADPPGASSLAPSPSPPNDIPAVAEPTLGAADLAGYVQPSFVAPDASTVEPAYLTLDSFGDEDDAHEPAYPFEQVGDRFIRADEKEKLTPDLPISGGGLELELDEFTLSNLSEDLSGLENVETLDVDGIAEIAALPLPELTFDSLATESLVIDSLEVEPPAEPPAPQPLLDSFANSLPSEATVEEGDDFTLDGLADTLATEERFPASALATSQPELPSADALQLPSSWQDASLEDFSASFSSAPSPEAAPVPAETEVAASEMTLDDAAGLFGDAAPTLPQPADALLPPSLANPPTADLPAPTAPFFPLAAATTPPPLIEETFTLEGMDDLFGSVAPVVPPPAISLPTDQPLPFTLEGMDDLFAEAPPAPSPSSEASSAPPPTSHPSPATKSIPPFDPSRYILDEPTEPLPPYQLEQLESLFVEPASPNRPDAPPQLEPLPTSLSDLQPSTVAPNIDVETLDQVFESFSELPPPPATPPQGPEKKKRQP
jgi:hypothetical protein